MKRMPRVAEQLARVLCGVAVLLAVGCRQDMRDQAKLQPFEKSRFFSDGVASRIPPEHTVARGGLRLDTHRFEGRVDGQLATELPMPVNLALLERGKERFEIFCAPCHDRTGSGNGIIVKRGYAVPRSFHDPDLRAQPVGYYFDVISRGFGTMPDYASQVPVDDRWAIVAYLRALQFSQAADVGLLEDDAIRQLELEPEPEVGEPGHGESH